MELSRTLLFFPLLLVLSCTVPPTVSEQISALKEACNAACDGDVSITVLIPAEGLLYTTPEAICIKTANPERLSCGTCSCNTYGPPEKDLFLSKEETTVSCIFKPSEETLDMSCA